MKKKEIEEKAKDRENSMFKLHSEPESYDWSKGMSWRVFYEEVEFSIMQRIGLIGDLLDTYLEYGGGTTPDGEYIKNKLWDSAGTIATMLSAIRTDYQNLWDTIIYHENLAKERAAAK